VIPLPGSGPAQSTGKALVLAAHGSRSHPAANAMVRKLAQSIRTRRLFDEVAVAFHQGEPGFDSVLDELSSESVTVVPILTSAGHYADVVLPRALRQNRRFEELRVRQSPPIGAHPRVAALVARRVTELLRESATPRQSVSLVIAGHGTRRHPASRSAAIALAETLRRRKVAGEVVAAFIDDDPVLESVVRNMAASRESRGSKIVVVPFFLGGAHVVKDIQGLLETHDTRLVIDRPLGDYPGLDEIVIDLARRHAPPPLSHSRGSAAPRLSGSVHLVGGGPGDPGLLTIRGLELLRQADVVVHDRLIGPELLDYTSRSAQLVDVGKAPGHSAYSQEEINGLLLQHARKGALVVRLKGGDPFIFGRGSEEVEACRAAGVQVEVVPGVSSALAAPAAAGIPLTARGVAQSFAVVTGHLANESTEAAVFPAHTDTLVILMGRSNLADLALGLISGGRDPNTPAACIQSATTADQRVTRATLATIAGAADRDGLVSPVVTVIGKVAALGDQAEIVRTAFSSERVASTA
jgi:uroporphyrin-III C-methyltransferase